MILVTFYDFIQQWEMRRQIVTGKQSYLQTMTELELRILFVQSACLTVSLRPSTYFSRYSYHLSSVFVMLISASGNYWIFSSGMKIRDGFLGTDNQNHLLEDGKKRLPHIGKDLEKEVGMGM